MKSKAQNSNITFRLVVIFGIILQAFFAVTIQAVELVANDENDTMSGKFKLKGQVMVDADRYGSIYDKNAENSTSNVYLRRAKATIKYTEVKNWEATVKLQYDYQDSDNNSHEIKDAFVTYSGFKGTDITVGKMKEPFSLDRLTSLSRSGGIERSMVSSAFTPGHSYGVQFGKNKKKFTWAIGAFQEATSGDSPQAITARATFAPLDNKNKTLHFGASATSRDYQGERFQIKERGEVNSADTVIRSARFNADKADLVGLELAWKYKSLILQSEWITEDIEQLNGVEWNYTGYYIQARIFLTGEKAKYQKGSFKQIKPSSGTGAWELVTRYSELDLRDNNLGSESSVAMVGVNFYWTRDFKIMVNYLKPDITGNVLHTDGSGDAISARLQYLF